MLTLSDTDNFRNWGGIQPRPASQGISGLVDRLGLALYDTMKIVNAEYSVVSRKSGWYGYTRYDGTIPEVGAQKAADSYLKGAYKNGPIEVRVRISHFHNNGTQLNYLESSPSTKPAQTQPVRSMIQRYVINLNRRVMCSANTLKTGWAQALGLLGQAKCLGQAATRVAKAG